MGPWHIHSYFVQRVRYTNFCFVMFLLLLFLLGEFCIGLLLNEQLYSNWAPNMISIHSNKLPIWWYPFLWFITNLLCQKKSNFKQNLLKASLLYYPPSMTVSESRGDRKWQLVTTEIKRDTCIVMEKIIWVKYARYIHSQGLYTTFL